MPFMHWLVLKARAERLFITLSSHRSEFLEDLLLVFVVAIRFDFKSHGIFYAGSNLEFLHVNGVYISIWRIGHS